MKKMIACLLMMGALCAIVSGCKCTDKASASKAECEMPAAADKAEAAVPMDYPAH